MNALEQELDYPHGGALPAPGRAMVVAPGVKWVRHVLPFALDHINVWLLRDRHEGRDGWAVVDCCITRDEAKAMWEEVFAHELEGLPVLRVFVTHMHPDHVGLAHWICARWNAPLWMSATDYYAARLNSQTTLGFGGEGAAAFFAAHGLADEGLLATIRGRASYYPGMVPAVPLTFNRLMDGDTLRIGEHDWACISGYGHAPEHISLHCASLGVLIGGDMMLPRISTNVSTYEIEPESNPLTLFLDSIDRFATLPADTLTLPSHGKPFRGLHARIRQLHDHHRDRLAEVLDACRERPHCAHDIVPLMFKRPLDAHQIGFALGEAVAHLHALWHDGQLVRRLDGNGVWRFSPP